MSDFWQIIEQILRLDFTALYDFSPLAIFFILFFGTFLSEDIACLAAGALAGQGRISFSLGLSACFFGIFLSDIALYWVGRIFGNSITKTRLFRRFINERRLTQATTWLEKRGAMAIVISRFVSGLRLPTYLGAGFLKANFAKFTLYFFAAAAVWTPILIGSAMFAQKLISPQSLLLTIVGSFLVFKLFSNLITWRKRRLFLGRLKRIQNWEFWPLKVFYFPVLIYILYLAIRHQSLNVFSCANPAIPAGGFAGESKAEIYEDLSKSQAASAHLLEYERISSKLSVEEKMMSVRTFLSAKKLGFPVALKPDAGERGKDTSIVYSERELQSLFAKLDEDLIVQEFACGPEVSIFYYRYPSSPTGKIFSMTEKSFPVVTGDGKSTLENLILRDERAVCMAETYFDQNADRLENIPKAGETVQLIDIGTHSRGAVFKEGESHKTDVLERKIDEICKGYAGFYFGRFDIRSLSFDSLKRGEDLKIIELNGVTSESTNIYDTRYSIVDAYRILFAQWRIAFEIGAENYKRGFKATSVLDLMRLALGWEIKDETRSKTKELCV